MSMLAMKPIRRVARQLRNRIAPGGLVLLYHRVNALPRDPQLLAVTPKHFDEHLEVMRRVGHVTTLAELDETASSGRTPRRSIVITFDDGYADNLTHAKPILERHDAPATVFVASDWIRTGASYFWDELGMLILEAQALPRELRLTVHDREHRWAPDDAACETRSDRAWNVLSETPASQRQRLYCELCELIRPLSAEGRCNALSTLRDQIAAAPSHVRESLTPADLNELARGDLIEIGAHTASHAMLSRLSPDEQRSEIERSRDELQAWIDKPARSFSYPFGSRVDLTAQTVAIVRTSGFDRACVNWPAVVRRGLDRYRIPRMLVRDWDGATFERQLRAWFND